MATLDQFEIEPQASYSGSYNNHVLYGSVFQTGSFFRREVIAEKPNIIDSSFRSKKILWTEHLSIISGTAIGATNRFLKLQSEQEFYYDSFGPQITKAYTLDAELRMNDWIQTNSLYSGSADFGIPPPAQFNFISIGITASGGGSFNLWFTTSSEASGNIHNDVWLNSFPFEKRYSAIERVFEPQYFTPDTFELPEDESFNVLTPPSKSNSILTCIYIIPGSGFTNSVKYVVVDLPVTGPMFMGGIYTNPTQEITKGSPTIRPSLTTFNKCVYGYGDGVEARNIFGTSLNRIALKGKSPSFRDMFWTNNGSNLFYMYSPIIRGYKYGLIDSSPKRYTHIFRRNKFGQNRDMLEQTQYSTTYRRIGSTITIDRPIQITFVSGTFSYSASITYRQSTEPVAFNLYDSGQYSTFYESGQPFHDI